MRNQTKKIVYNTDMYNERKRRQQKTQTALLSLALYCIVTYNEAIINQIPMSYIKLLPDA